MTSTTSTFDPTSPFVTFATTVTRGTVVSVLRGIGMQYGARITDALHMYFTNTYFLKKIVQFRLLVNNYLHTCYDEYLLIHQQILDKKLEKSDLNEDNMDHYVYYHLDKIISQTDGYKHINCVFDSLMIFCTYQFKHLFVSMSQENPVFGTSANSPNGDSKSAELTLLRHILNTRLDQINASIQTKFLNDEEYQNIRLKCEEDNSCELNFENVKQRLEEQQQSLLQERETSGCNCEHEH